MISRLAVATSLAPAEEVLNQASSNHAVANALRWADAVLLWSGLVLLGILIARRLIRRKGSLLSDAPLRPNTLTPEIVLLPIAAFVLVYSLCWPVTKRLAQGYAEFGAALAANSAGMMVGTATCVWIGRRFFKGGARRFLGGSPSVGRSAAEGLVWLMIALPLCSIVYYLTLAGVQHFRPDYVPREHDVIQALRDAGEPPWSFATLWLGSALVAPVAEECFFRGILQTLLGNLVRWRWAAVLIVAAVFGLAHHSQWHVVPAIAVLGVILGLAYERSGSLVGPITLHVLFNCKTLVWEVCGAAGP